MSIELTTLDATRRGGAHLKQLALKASISFYENECAVSHPLAASSARLAEGSAVLSEGA